MKKNYQFTVKHSLWKVIIIVIIVKGYLKNIKRPMQCATAVHLTIEIHTILTYIL